MMIIGASIIFLCIVSMLTVISLGLSLLLSMIFVNRRLYDFKHIFWSWIISCVGLGVCLTYILIVNGWI